MKRSAVIDHALCQRTRLLRLAGCLGLAALAPPAHAQDDVLGQMDRQVTAIVARVKPSVVSIRVGRPDRSQTPDARRQRSQRQGDRSSVPLLFSGAGRLAPDVIFGARVGTGFVVDRDGTIVTTADVVGNTDRVTVKLSDGRELDGKVLGADAPTGVAVIKVAGGELPALRLADRDRPEPGQWTIIVGNQLDEADSVWVGTLARTGVALAPAQPEIEGFPGMGAPALAMARLAIRPFSSLPEGKLLQIDAPVGPGASGAPVLNSHGEVIGVVVATSNPRPQPLLGQGGPREDRTAPLRESLKENPDWQRQAQEIAGEAQRIGQRAAAHARVLSEQIAARAKRMAGEATQRSMALRERFAKEKRQIEADPSKSEAERQRLEAERARQMEQEMRPLAQDLQRQLDQELKPLEEELSRQMQGDLQPLQEQLRKLNETLPMVQGLREISVDLAPQIAAAVAQAHEAARAAVEAAMQACEAGAAVATPAVPGAKPGVNQLSEASDGALAGVRTAGPHAGDSDMRTGGPHSGTASGAAQSLPPSASLRALALTILADTPNPATPSAPAAPAAEPPAPPEPAPPAAVVIPAAPLAPSVRFWAGRSPAGGASTYAIPAATVAWAANQIREHGRVAHPFLGLQLQALRPEERERLNAPEQARVRVERVAPGSPAQEAGLQKDDLILEIQAKKVEGPADVVDRIGHARVGDRVTLVIWRSGKQLTLDPTLREQSGSPWRFSRPNFTMPGPPFVMTQPPALMPNGPLPRVMRLYSPGHVAASASGTGRGALVTLEAQDAELTAVLRELSRATGLRFTAEGDAARQPVTLKVERVPVNDLVESLERLYHLRSERQGDTITFRSR